MVRVVAGASDGDVAGMTVPPAGEAATVETEGLGTVVQQVAQPMARSLIPMIWAVGGAAVRMDPRVVG